MFLALRSDYPPGKSYPVSLLRIQKYQRNLRDRVYFRKECVVAFSRSHSFARSFSLFLSISFLLQLLYPRFLCSLYLPLFPLIGQHVRSNSLFRYLDVVRDKGFLDNPAKHLTKLYANVILALRFAEATHFHYTSFRFSVEFRSLGSISRYQLPNISKILRLNHARSGVCAER